MSEENVEAVRKAFEYWHRGDLDAFWTFPTTTWSSGHESGIEGDLGISQVLTGRKGKAVLIEYFWEHQEALEAPVWRNSTLDLKPASHGSGGSAKAVPWPLGAGNPICFADRSRRRWLEARPEPLARGLEVLR